MASRTQYPRINPGQRAILAGRTGSGKSTLASWLMLRSAGHWVIINPKWTKAFDDFKPDVPESKRDKVIDNKIVGIDTKLISASIAANRFTIINPASSETDPETLDLLIQWLHESYTDIGIYVDELTMVHNGYIAGPGLIGVLTRGRELQQAFIGVTQRPACISKFLFSEADFICGMSLNTVEDRKRMYSFTGREQFLVKLKAREWLWYDVGADELQAWGPIPLTK